LRPLTAVKILISQWMNYEYCGERDCLFVLFMAGNLVALLHRTIVIDYIMYFFMIATFIMFIYASIIQGLTP